MKPEGLCLLERQEFKYPLEYKKIPKAIKILKQKGFKLEYYGKEKQIELRNVVFDIPEAKELDVYFRNNYARARIRSYHGKKYKSKYWGEWRTKIGFNVTKKRKLLHSNKELLKFLATIRTQGLIFNNFSSYTRTAFNHKKEKIRVTIDTNINYLNQLLENITPKIFPDNKKAIIKFKFKEFITDEQKELLMWFK